MPRRKLKPIRLAVLSDLHVGRGARSADLSPYDDSNRRSEKYMLSFNRYVKDNGLKADYVIVPGDVSHEGAPQEIALASRVVTDCASAFHLDDSRIIFVPGNHDADWSVLRPGDVTGFRRTQKFAPLQHREWVFTRILDRSGKHLLNDEHSFAVWEYDDLLVVGYNSSWDDDPHVAVHHGLACNEHLSAIEKYLPSLDLSPRRLRLFVVHHHPILYSDPLPNEPDFSAMTNAPRLLSILRRFNFDFLIHGHRHSPSFQTLTVDSHFPLAILCAGSFSAYLDDRWSGYVNNQFHIVQVDGRENQSGCIFGDVKSWTYLAQHGWKPSELHNGIRHVSPFGAYLHPPKLATALGRMIRHAFKSSDYVMWNELVKLRPQLRHVPGSLLHDVLERLAPEIGFHYGETTAGLTLFRGEGGK